MESLNPPITSTTCKRAGYITICHGSRHGLCNSSRRNARFSVTYCKHCRHCPRGTPETARKSSQKNLDPDRNFGPCTFFLQPLRQRKSVPAISAIESEVDQEAECTLRPAEDRYRGSCCSARIQSVYDTRGTPFKEARSRGIQNTCKHPRDRARESQKICPRGPQLENTAADRHREEERRRTRPEKGRQRYRERERDTSILPLTNCIRLSRAAHGKTNSTLFSGDGDGDGDGDNSRRRRSFTVRAVSNCTECL